MSELNCNDDDTNAGLFATLVYSTYDEVSAFEAVPVNRDAVIPFPIILIPLLDTVNEPVIIALPLNGNPAVLDPAFNAYDAVVAIPVNEPENDPE